MFGRLPSPTVSTQCLHIDGTTLHRRSHQWGTFTIHLGIIDRPELGKREDLTPFFSLSLSLFLSLPEVNEIAGEKFSFIDGVVHYGQTVKIVCTKTGWDLPLLV